MTQNAMIHRSADATLLYFLETDISSGPVFTYNANTNSFSPRVQSNYYLAYAGSAVNRNGSLVGTVIPPGGGGASLDTVPNFNFVAPFNGLDGGIAFDALQDRFYAVNNSAKQIVAYDTNTFAELLRLNIAEALSNGVTEFGAGNLIASADGRYLALATPSGIRLFNVADGTPSPPPTPTFDAPTGMVFDHAGQHLYFATEEGWVWPYNLSSGQFEIPYNVGGFLVGIDIAPDDSFLLIAQYEYGMAQGAFQRLDLHTGQVTNISYPRIFGEGGGWTVAIGSNGLAMATTEFEGSGWTPLRQINLATNAITVRTDDPGSGPSGQVQQETQIQRSADGSRMYLLEPNSSLGPLFTYSATTNSFGPTAKPGFNNGIVSAAVNRNGTLLGTRFSTATLDTAPNFGFVNVFNGVDSGVAFDATKDIFYGVNSSTDQIIAYDTNTSAELFRIDIGEDVSHWSTQFGPGTLVASQDGNYLALMTQTAIRIFAVSDGAPFPSTPTFGTPQDMVFDHAGGHLYITTKEGLL